jgi:hypothetical protein
MNWKEIINKATKQKFLANRALACIKRKKLAVETASLPSVK